MVFVELNNDLPNGPRVLVCVPTDEGEENPLKPVQVDYIDRLDGPSAGSGDVYISHTFFSPTDEMIHLEGGPPDSWTFCDYKSQNNKVWTYPRFQWGYDWVSYFGPNSMGYLRMCYWYPVYDNKGKVQFVYRRSEGWYITGSVFSDGPPADAIATLYNEVVVNGRGTTSNMEFWKGSIWVESPEVVPTDSALDTFLWNRQLGFATGRAGFDKSLCTAAFYKAAENLPVVQQNTMANIVELLSTLVSLLDGFDASDLRNIKKVGSDLWLRYRYQYNTTISDMEEILNVVSRLEAIASKEIATYGYASDGEVEVHCEFKTHVSLPSSVNEWLKSVNLRPTLVNVWDVIPYSFVVDWFFKIGPMLEDLQKWLDAETLDVSELWYSVFKTSEPGPGILKKEYIRWRGNPPRMPYFFSHETSSRTIGYRIMDAITLFL